VPLRVEIGPRDLAARAASVSRRDRGPKEREAMPLAEFAGRCPALLEEIQAGLFARARTFRESHSVRLDSQAAIHDYFAGPLPGFAHAPVADDPAVAAALDPLKVTVRCIPMEGPDEPGTCVITGRPVSRRSVLARAY